MVSYLCNFARIGDPNCDGDLPVWKASSQKQKKVLVIGEGETRMAKPNTLKMLKTMLTNKAVGE